METNLVPSNQAINPRRICLQHVHNKVEGATMMTSVMSHQVESLKRTTCAAMVASFTTKRRNNEADVWTIKGGLKIDNNQPWKKEREINNNKQ